MAVRQGKNDGGLFQRHDHASCPPLEVVGHDEHGKPIHERPEHHCRGRWVAQVDLGYVNGKRRRKVVYGKTREQARQARTKANREKDRGTVVIAAPTVETWLRYWLDVVCPERGTKVNTMKGYRSKVETYLIPYLGRHRLDKLTPEHLRAMYRTLREVCPAPDEETGKCPHSPRHPGLSEATLRQTHAILHRALKVAEREGKVGRNVAGLIDPPATTRNKRKGLTVEQARNVLASDDLRLWVALYLGLRQGEALGLRWSDVDLELGVLYVQRGLIRAPGEGLTFDTPKSRASVRVVPIPPHALARFKVARLAHDAAGGDPDALVFNRDGKPLDPRADWQHWTDSLASVGVPHVALHAARNTTASLLEAAGVSDRVVMQILGQSSVQVTHGYQHQDVDRLREAMLALESYVEG